MQVSIERYNHYNRTNITRAFDFLGTVNAIIVMVIALSRDNKLEVILIY